MKKKTLTDIRAYNMAMCMSIGVIIGLIGMVILIIKGYFIYSWFSVSMGICVGCLIGNILRKQKRRN